METKNALLLYCGKLTVLSNEKLVKIQNQLCVGDAAKMRESGRRSLIELLKIKIRNILRKKKKCQKKAAGPRNICYPMPEVAFAQCTLQ